MPTRRALSPRSVLVAVLVLRRGRLLVVGLEQGRARRPTRRRRADRHGRRSRPPISARVRDQPRERELRDHVGADVAGEVPQRHAAAAGPAAHAVLRDRPREPRQLHRADQRAGAEPADAGRLHRRTPSSCRPAPARTARRSGRVACSRSRCRRSATSSTPRARRGRRTRRTSRTRATRAEDVPAPARSARSTRRSSRPRPTCTRRVTTRGCTSTRSSTRPRATTNVVGLDALTTDLAVGGDDAEPVVHHAERVRRRPRRAVQGRPARRADVGRRVPEDVGAEDPRVARVQGRRHARDHVRRGGDRRRRRRRDRVLPHAAVAEHAEARPQRPGRRAGRRARDLGAHEAGHDERHAVQPLLVAVQHGERVRASTTSASRARPASPASARTCTTRVQHPRPEDARPVRARRRPRARCSSNSRFRDRFNCNDRSTLGGSKAGNHHRSFHLQRSRNTEFRPAARRRTSRPNLCLIPTRCMKTQGPLSLQRRLSAQLPRGASTCR